MNRFTPLWEEGLSFDDVLLKPQLGSLDTRKNADISVSFNKNRRLPVPIISAPMSSVTEGKMAEAMWWAGGMGIVHRFMEVDKQISTFINHAPFHDGVIYEYAGCAIGVNEEYRRLNALVDSGINIICLDVAHAHHIDVLNFIDKMPHRKEFTLIAGNVSTCSGVRDLVNVGVDVIKVGIGPGAACTTRSVTGFGTPQLTAIIEANQTLINMKSDNTKIIADGGIKTSGDIVKALAAGADFVMCGRILAGADEAPHPGEYFGMASKRVNGHNAPEGAEGEVPTTGPVGEIIKQLSWGIKSGISYGGGFNIEDLRRKAVFIKVAPGVFSENGVRFD